MSGPLTMSHNFELCLDIKMLYMNHDDLFQTQPNKILHIHFIRCIHEKKKCPRLHCLMNFVSVRKIQINDNSQKSNVSCYRNGTPNLQKNYGK